MSFRFPFAGLIITGGEGTATSIETFPVDADATCTIPPFPEPGNLSSFSSSHSPPKGECGTPSLSLKTVGNLSPAEVTTPGLTASLGGVAKMIGLTMRHWGEIWSSCHINPLFSKGRFEHAAVVLPTTRPESIFIIGGRDSSFNTGEIVKGIKKFSQIGNQLLVMIFCRWEEVHSSKWRIENVRSSIQHRLRHNWGLCW